MGTPLRSMCLATLVLACSSRDRSEPPRRSGSGSAAITTRPSLRPPPIGECTEIAAQALPRGYCDKQILLFIDENLVAVLISSCSGPRDAPGIVVYDLRVDHMDPHRADPLYSFEIEATAGDAIPNTRKMMLAGPALGVAMFDLSSGCIRASTPIAVEHVAFDTARERFFVVSAGELLRIDGASLTPERVASQLPGVDRLAYDPITDRVLARAGRELWTYDAATIATPPKHQLRGTPISGPWVRPGRAEAVVLTHDRMRWELALIDLRTGKELRAIPLPGEPYDHATWSPDGALFVIDQFATDDGRVAWQPETGLVKIKPRHGLVLGPGDRFVRVDSRYLVAGSTRRWDHMYHEWSVYLPY